MDPFASRSRLCSSASSPLRTGPSRSRPRRSAALAALLSLAVTWTACESGVGIDPVRVDVLPEAGLIVGVGATARFTMTVTGADGRVVAGTDGVIWETMDPDIATIDAQGIATGVSGGATRIAATWQDATATAGVEVYVPPEVTTYEPGVSYFGRNDYVEYVPGELPVVFSAPHGGDLEPSEVATRTWGVTVTDTNTRELTLAVRDALIDLTGMAPHVVISHLDRAKLDPNREIVEAAQGDPFAERAWEEFHGFIEEARTTVGGTGGGMYFDMHGHGHPEARLELGYLLSAEELDGDDASLDGAATMEDSSIRELGLRSPLPFSALLRGAASFGGLLEDRSVPSVPSPSILSPGSDPYFSGGYSTWRHGSIADGEVVSGIQIEHHFPGLRDSDANRRAYAALLAEAVRDFMLDHYGYFEP